MLLRSLGSGVSGLKNFQTYLDVIGNNIANVNTAGYKKARVNFEDMFSEERKGATGIGGAQPAANYQSSTNPTQIGLGSQVGSVDNIVTAGPINPTDNPMDLAIDGEGYFRLQDAAGNQFYSRAGNFKTNTNGELVNAQGMELLAYSDANDPNSALTTIDLSGYSNFTVADDGTVSGIGVGNDGVGTANDVTVIGKIALSTFSNPAGLDKLGNSLYQETVASGTPNSNFDENNQGDIIQGALEASNVDLTDEMTSLIEAQRAYQANARTITTADQILQELVGLKR